jgi:plasmid maintenance system antidote protein VapI
LSEWDHTANFLSETIEILRMAHLFGTSAEFWLNLQSLYELRIAQEKAGKSIQSLPRLERRDMVHA